jgi:hypothetical protein
MHHDQINPHTYYQSATIPSNYPESLNLLWAGGSSGLGLQYISLFYYRSFKNPSLEDQGKGTWQKNLLERRRFEVEFSRKGEGGEGVLRYARMLCIFQTMAGFAAQPQSIPEDLDLTIDTLAISASS